VKSHNRIKTRRKRRRSRFDCAGRPKHLSAPSKRLFFLEMACENTPLQGSRLVVEEGNEEFLRFLAVRLIELRQAAAV
jgi:hypothetical protein